MEAESFINVDPEMKSVENVDDDTVKMLKNVLADAYGKIHVLFMYYEFEVGSIVDVIQSNQ